MRRLVFSVIVATGLVLTGSSTAFADDPAPTVSAKATPGKKICKITDTKLDELSGIVATKSGFVVVDDSSTLDNHKRVFFLNNSCKIVNSVKYDGSPIDTEDLILSPDGKTLWIADTGDDGVRAVTPTHRDHVALWSMKADGSSDPVIYRVAYPEGDYHDTEALLLQGNSTPILVTKELGKPASIYEPAAALKVNKQDSVPLKKVGELTVSGTTTPSNTVAQIGNKTIDGGAIAPGGAKVALRTYTDALEWDVTNGDVLGALKNGKPRTTGLPNEPFGEAITYSPDGKFFYTVSDMNGDHTTANYIMQYTPATTVAVAAKSSEAGGPTTHWYSNLTLNEITLMVGGVGLIGLILVGVGVLGIMRSRKRAATEPASYGGDDSPPGDPETELIGVGGAPQRAGVYGGARSGGIPPAGGGSGANSGAVYGAGGSSGGGGAQRGPVYGNGGGAPQYARPAAGQQPPARGGQPPARGGQPPARNPQQGPGRNGVYSGDQQGGGGQGRGPAPQGGQRPPGGQGRGPAPQGGGQGRGPAPQGGQRPQGGGGQGRGPAPQGGQRPSGGGGQGRGPAPQGGQGRGSAPQGGQGRGSGPQGGSGQGRGSAPQGGQRPQGGGQGRGAAPQGGQRPQGGGQGGPQGGGRPQGQRPQDGGTYGQRPQRGDGRAEYAARPESRFDNPGYRR
jgi:hypothetical protein